MSVEAQSWVMGLMAQSWVFYGFTLGLMEVYIWSDDWMINPTTGCEIEISENHVKSSQTSGEKA